MIGVRVFLYIMYNVSVVLNTSLLAARFCNIKKSKRERDEETVACHFVSCELCEKSQGCNQSLWLHTIQE